VITVEPVAVIPRHRLENRVRVRQAEAGEDEGQGGKGDHGDPRGRGRQHHLSHAHRIPLLTEGERQAESAEDRDGGTRQENAMVIAAVGKIHNRRQQHGSAEETDDDAGEKEHRPDIDRVCLEDASVVVGDGHGWPRRIRRSH
jgi:hypothetical protein